MPFAADDELATVEVDGVAIEADEFGNTETTGEEKLDDSAVAETGLGVGRDDVEDFFDFIVVEESNLLFDGAGEVDEGRVERLDVAASEIFEKTAEGNEVVSLSQSRETFISDFVFVTIETKTIFSEEFGVNVGGGENILSKKVGADFVKAVEIKTIVFDGLF